jgi:hypothetical protein
MGPRTTHIYNAICGASDRATQFTGYIGVGLCGASGTHFTELVRVCRLTPELPFKCLFLQRSRSLGPKCHICYSPTSMGPISQNLVRVCRLTLEVPLRGSFRRGKIWSRSRSLKVNGQKKKLSRFAPNFPHIYVVRGFQTWDVRFGINIVVYQGIVS